MKNPLLGALVMLMGTFSLAAEKSVNNSTILEVGTCTYTIVVQHILNVHLNINN